MFTQDRRRQHDMAISEMAARDVFFYNGHAGPYYGFYLDANEAARAGHDATGNVARTRQPPPERGPACNSPL